MAQEVGLLSLPDELLAIIATGTRRCSDQKSHRVWVYAALTCKRLWELQLSGFIFIDTWEGLEWHLKRLQNVWRLFFHFKEWPSDAEQLQKLSTSVTELSSNLLTLQHLDIWPRRSETPPQQALTWISGMLSGASNLKSAWLGVEMLDCLPVSRREALKKLHLDARIEQAHYVPEIVKAVVDCKQLESLTIDCPSPGWHVPELDLQRLVHLKECNLKGLPAPGSLRLSLGKGECRMSLDELTAWLELSQPWRNCMYYLNVHNQNAWLGVLTAWPKGIDTFRYIQFLKMDWGDMVPSTSKDILDLAHFAHILHVSLRSRNRLTISISTGGWKVLDLQSGNAFTVYISDVEAFLKSTYIFSFTFPRKESPNSLIEKLKSGS